MQVVNKNLILSLEVTTGLKLIFPLKTFIRSWYLCKRKLGFLCFFTLKGKLQQSSSRSKNTSVPNYAKAGMFTPANRRHISCIFSVTWLPGDVKKPTHLLQSMTRGSRCCGLALSHGLVLHIGLTSLRLSLLDRIVQEKLPRLTMSEEIHLN